MLAANSVDVHGRFGPMSNEYVTIKNGEYYGIPYRCLLPLGICNMLIAGRSISTTSEAAGAIRVMPPCMGTGQATGIAAALAVKGNTQVNSVDVWKLRKAITEQGGYLK